MAIDWAAKGKLVLKGMCMGVADVIPGVSGGTLALILGIYTQFIEAVKSVDHRPVVALLRWIASGFGKARRDELIVALKAVHFGFLIPLVIGIGSALAVGSVIIPSLMESYPEIMRGLFFGLILASVTVPFRLIPRESRSGLAVALVLAIVGAVVGYLLTDPNAVVNTTSDWVKLEARQGETLKDIARRGPSSQTTEQVFWAKDNAPLRQAVATATPDHFADLESAHKAAGQLRVTDKGALKSRSKPYDELVVPVGTTVRVPRPGYFFILLAGAIAICAMVLPGVSGSFLLLILGCYYFILNAIKGSLGMLAAGMFPTDNLTFVGLFLLGLLVGIASFTRLLSYLLKHHTTPTMGLLSGLMVGCLRGVWPFQRVVEGDLENYFPSTFGVAQVGALVAALVGIAVVVGLGLVGRRRGDGPAPAAS